MPTDLNSLIFGKSLLHIIGIWQLVLVCLDVGEKRS